MSGVPMLFQVILKYSGLSAMPEPDKMLRIRTVLQRTGLSRSTVYRKMKDGSFPRKIKISEHCCGWRESTVNRWIADPPSYSE
jgi:prophage regulatory protein